MEKEILSRRHQLIWDVVKHRQPTIAVLLENVHDPMNIGAVMRSCDSIGIMEVFLLYTQEQVSQVKLGKRSSAGARKWLDVYHYNDAQRCINDIKNKYHKLYTTHLDSDACSHTDLNLTESVVLAFGNEHAGLSQEVLNYSDGNFIIPQMGMVKSLNISVAAAVTLYEAMRQRSMKGMYDVSQFSPEQEKQVFKNYLDRQKSTDSQRFAESMNE